MTATHQILSPAPSVDGAVRRMAGIVRAIRAVARREISERKAIVFLALVVGLMPLGFPLLPGIEASDRGPARAAAALALFAILLVLVPAFAGISMLGRDLAERRLSFFLTKPLPALAVWGGKLAGAVGLAALALAPAAVVAFSATLDEPRLALTPARMLTAAAFALLGIGLGGVGAVALRSRSRFVGIDVLAALLCTPLAAWTVAAVTHAQTFRAIVLTTESVPGFVLPLLAALALLVASAVGAHAGRADHARVHRFMTFALWPLLALGMGATGLWARSTLVTTPARLTHVEAPFWRPSLHAGGRWLTIEGLVRDRHDMEARFLVDTTSGRALQVSPGAAGQHLAGEEVVSADGRRALWLSVALASARTVLGMEDVGARRRLVVTELADGTARNVPLESALNPYHEAAALIAPDGRHAALLGENATVEGWDLDALKPLATVSLGGAKPTPGASAEEHALVLDAEFVSPTLVRAYLRAASELEIVEIDIVAGRAEHLGRIPWFGKRPARASSRCDRLVELQYGDEPTAVRSARTGAVVGAIAGPAGRLRQLHFLSDCTMLVEERPESTLRLRWLDRDGHDQRATDLPVLAEDVRTNPLIAAGGPAGKIVVGWLASRAPTRIVDLATGATTPLPVGLVPVARPRWPPLAADPFAETTTPSSASVMLVGPGPELVVRLDPATGARTTLVHAAR